MLQLDRIEQERLFHDRQATERAARFAGGREDLRFDDDEYLDHESWIRPAFELLGNLEGRHVLDLGCGHGMASVVLARRGAVVTGIDLSSGYVAEARERIRVNRMAGEFIVADAERLPFAENSFDAVWGCAILHHLEIPAAANELKRILKPGGVIVLCEPWGGNHLLAWARRRLPYPGKHRTPDEKPLTADDLSALKEVFPETRTRGFQLLGMVRRLWSVRRSPICGWFDWLDGQLFRSLPILENQARYVVLTIRK